MAYDDDVDIRKAHSAMLIIKALDSTAHLDFSGITSTWWVVTRIGIAGNNGELTTGALCSNKDPNQAVIGYLLALQAVKVPQYVTLTSDSSWKGYWFRWNGAAFARVGVHET